MLKFSPQSCIFNQRPNTFRQALHRGIYNKTILTIRNLVINTAGRFCSHNCLAKHTGFADGGGIPFSIRRLNINIAGLHVGIWIGPRSQQDHSVLDVIIVNQRFHFYTGVTVANYIPSHLVSCIKEFSTHSRDHILTFFCGNTTNREQIDKGRIEFRVTGKLRFVQDFLLVDRIVIDGTLVSVHRKLAQEGIQCVVRHKEHVIQLIVVHIHPPTMVGSVAEFSVNPCRFLLGVSAVQQIQQPFRGLTMVGYCAIKLCITNISVPLNQITVVIHSILLHLDAAIIDHILKQPANA